MQTPYTFMQMGSDFKQTKNETEESHIHPLSHCALCEHDISVSELQEEVCPCNTPIPTGRQISSS